MLLLSIAKIIISTILPTAIFSIFGLWNKTQIKKTLCSMLSVVVLSNIGAEIILKSLKNNGSIYERLLMIAVFSVFLSSLFLIFIKKEKLTGEIILKTTCLLCVAAAIYSTLTRGQAYMHSDAATATLLVQSQIEKRALLPSSWQYANGDIWILGSNTFTFPFVILLKNQTLARMLGSASLIITTALGIVFMSRKLFHNDSWLLMIPLFLVFHPNGDVSNNNILWEAGYTSSILWMTLGVTLACDAIFQGNKVSICLYGLLALTLSSQGIRFSAEQAIPLIGTSCIHAYCEIRNDSDIDRKTLLNQMIRTILVVVLPTVLGLGIYKYICSSHNVNDVRSGMKFVSSSTQFWKNVEIYISYLFECFGYNHGIRMISADGIWNLFVLVLCPLICIVTPIMQAIKLWKEETEIKSFYTYGLLHNCLIFITIALLGNVDSPRYLLTTVFINIAISSRFIYVYWLKESNFRGVFWSSIFAVSALLACVMLVSQSRGWVNSVWVQKQFNQGLIERNLDKGYATYWNAYKNEVFSDLSIRYGGINIINDRKIVPFMWLVDADVFIPGNKPTFLLLDEKENITLSESIPLIFGEPEEMVYESGQYVYIFDHDIAFNMYSLADGVLKPIELYTNDVVIIENGECILPSGACVYGPYERLGAGEYEVTFSGDHLDQAYCDVQSVRSPEALSYSETVRSGEEVVYDLILTEDVNDIEFRTFNRDSETPIILKQIEIRKKSQQNSDYLLEAA